MLRAAIDRQICYQFYMIAELYIAARAFDNLFCRHADNVQFDASTRHARYCRCNIGVSLRAVIASNHSVTQSIISIV